MLMIRCCHSVDATNLPIGVTIPLSDWPFLQSAVKFESPFYKLMAVLTFLPFHERSLQEQSAALEEKVREVEKENLLKGSFISYKNELCVSADLFINEYAEHKELVSVNSQSGKISLIRKLD